MMKKGITLLAPAKNEERYIEDFLIKFKPYVDYIVVVENDSDDNTLEIAKKYADKVVRPEKIECLHKKEIWEESDINEEHFCSIYNSGMREVPTVWTLSADFDESWDLGLLEKLKDIVERYGKATCIRFPRINLPDSNNFPDYQVRLVKTVWTVWKHTPHVIPYFRGKEKLGEEIIEYPLDQTTGVVTIDDHPIIHSERRKDIKRPWWGVEL